MAEPLGDPQTLVGKGKRVTGTLLLLLGAGIVLESSRQWMGGMVLFAGAVTFVRGLLDARPRTLAPSQTHVAIDAPSEGRP